jgi:cell division septum initiation protein DivIVA
LVLWASIAALLGLAGMAFAWQRRRHAPRKGASGAGTGQAPREEQARIKRRLRGYDPRTVDRLVRETANLHRQLTNEKEELTERVATLERELEQYRAAESSLAGALVYSEKVAAERQEQARQEAEELIQAAQEERARLQAEIERLEARRDELITSYRAFVLVALELLEEHDTGQETPAEPSPLR